MSSQSTALQQSAGPSEANVSASMKFKLRLSDDDLGRPESLRHVVLSAMEKENYAMAIEQLKFLSESQGEYPQFKERASRYISYAIDLVHGIKAKRSFPGVNTLPVTKQQELHEKSVLHLQDLRATLKKLEQIESDVRLEDLRSTVWVIKAVCYGVFGILALAFLMEVFGGLLGSVQIVLESLSEAIADRLFSAIGY